MSVAELDRPKTSAPGQYLGYALQPVRLCHHLLSVSDNSSVSLEYLDDVAVHAPGGGLLLEQAKSALFGNPATNRSSELWKTLANWADLCVAGMVQATQTRFSYYVTPMKTGPLVQAMHGATNQAAATKMLKNISSNKFKGDPTTGAGPDILRFLAAGEDICRDIIVGFHFMTEPDPLDAVRGHLRAIIPPEMLDSISAAAIGMAKDIADRLIRNRQNAIIDAVKFRAQFRAFVTKHNLSSLLNSTTGKPTDDKVQSLLSESPVFVRQLDAVGASTDLVVTAVSDFLRTSADKINWADEGRVYEHSFDDLDAELVRNHTIQRDEVEELYAAKSPAQRGRALYRKCIDLKIPLEGRVLPSHFVPGAYNCLANDCQLGWHPEYKSLFKGQ